MNTIHTGERPYSCDLCKISFTKTANLTRHNKINHQGPYECDLCGDKFSNKPELETHLHKHVCKNSSACYTCHTLSQSESSAPPKKRNPQENRLHYCLVCDRSFPFASGVKAHLRTHTGEKPFACNQCNQSFAHSGGLSYHKRIVHQEIDPSHFCDVCDRGVFSATELNQHLQISSRIIRM